MPTDIKGPAIFLAQFEGDTAPFDSLAGMARWAAGLGYKGLQLPTGGRLVDLALAGGDLPSLVAELHARAPGSRTLLLSDYDDPLADAAAAHRELAESAHIGKILLLP